MAFGQEELRMAFGQEKKSFTALPFGAMAQMSRGWS